MEKSNTIRDDPKLSLTNSNLIQTIYRKLSNNIKRSSSIPCQTDNADAETDLKQRLALSELHRRTSLNSEIYLLPAFRYLTTNNWSFNADQNALATDPLTDIICTRATLNFAYRQSTELKKAAAALKTIEPKSDNDDDDESYLSLVSKKFVLKNKILSIKFLDRY